MNGNFRVSPYNKLRKSLLKKRKTYDDNFKARVASEHEQMFLNDAKFIDSRKSFGSVPITVIAASIPNPAFGENAEEYQKYWISESKQVSKKSTNGEMVKKYRNNCCSSISMRNNRKYIRPLCAIKIKIKSCIFNAQ